MKKSKLILCTSALLMLASCGGHPTGLSVESTHPTGLSTESTEPTGLSTLPSEVSAEPVDIDLEAIIGTIENQEDMDLLVWCAEEILPTVTNTVNDYVDEISEFYEGTITVTLNPVGEGTAATNMVTDVESGADIYFFAQDQLARLNTAGALAEVPELFSKKVRAENSAGSVGAGSLNNKLIAYPATEDNGYYLYYDKSVLSEEDIKDWETIIAKAEAQEKEVDINYSSAWYNFGFFYGAGADSIWHTNPAGDFISYDDTYDEDAGLVAARAMANIITSGRVVDNSGVSGAGANCIALVDGAWDYGAAVTKWGDNLGCAELPSYTVDGQKYHTGSFSGNKLIGVKPQVSEARSVITALIGLELNSYEAQDARYDAKGWGPCNVELVASEKIQAAPHLQALVAQNAYAKPQGQFPGKWWDLAGAIGTSVKAAGKEASDDELQGILDLYHASLDSCLD